MLCAELEERNQAISNCVKGVVLDLLAHLRDVRTLSTFLGLVIVDLLDVPSTGGINEVARLIRCRCAELINDDQSRCRNRAHEAPNQVNTLTPVSLRLRLSETRN